MACFKSVNALFTPFCIFTSNSSLPLFENHPHQSIRRGLCLILIFKVFPVFEYRPHKTCYGLKIIHTSIKEEVFVRLQAIFYSCNNACVDSHSSNCLVVYIKRVISSMTGANIASPLNKHTFFPHLHPHRNPM